MVNGNDYLRIDAKRLKAEIENLRYDRDLIVQQKQTFPYGIFNKKLLDSKLFEIDQKIAQLQKKLEHCNNMISLSEPGNQYRSVEGIKQLIRDHSRYLQKLKEQQAKLGIHTPPHILIEIEEKEEEIGRLQMELKSLSS